LEEVGSAAARLIISGYYGFHNSGDEAVLQSILLALKSESVKQGITIEPIVLSIDPAWTSQTYGVQAVHRMKLREVLQAIRQSDGLISGGGSLLQDATGRMSIPYYLGIIKLAQWFGKPTFIYAQGIGPVNRTIFNPFIRSIFRKCRYISVRDEESAGLLERIGISRETIEVVPDPVMGLPLQKDNELHRERTQEHCHRSSSPAAYACRDTGKRFAYWHAAAFINIRGFAASTFNRYFLRSQNRSILAKVRHESRCYNRPIQSARCSSCSLAITKWQWENRLDYKQKTYDREASIRSSSTCATNRQLFSI
jgi:hypothetical protein